MHFYEFCEMVTTLKKEFCGKRALSCCAEYQSKRSLTLATGPCHGSGAVSPATHSICLGSVPGQPTFDSWCAQRHQDTFLSEFFGYPAVSTNLGIVPSYWPFH
jgi:hypothetical protein